MKIPRQYVHDWPPRTDCCPRCYSPDGVRPAVEEQRGLKILSGYVCPDCLHSWVSSWLVEA